MKYNWQLPNWPNFTYSTETFFQKSLQFAQTFGEFNGIILGINKELKQEALLEILINEAIKTSELEGEFMSREDVMSSIKNNLGIYPKLIVKDKKASSIAEMLVHVQENLNHPLSLELICTWHKLLMKHNQYINAGAWRTSLEPMQIISGSYGKETVHFEAPPSSQVPIEMNKIILWYNSDHYLSNDNISSTLLKSAITHLYFETIHPFEDGNGRVGRALADFTLSKCLGSPILFSLSKSIEKNKKVYYQELKKAQSDLEITSWINYFASIILDAQIDAKELLKFTLLKSKFFEKFGNQLNIRQTKVLNRMLMDGNTDFEGGITAKKYMHITKTTKATATRDLQFLHQLGVLTQFGLGRSVSYQISPDNFFN